MSDIDDVERKIIRVYKQAQKDIEKKIRDFVRKYEARDKLMRKRLEDGKITAEDYKAWKQGQVFMGKRWDEKKKEIETILMDATKVAREYVGEAEYNVFRDNSNQVATDLGINLGTSFEIYDLDTVKRLIMEDPELLPRRKMDADKVSGWCQSLIANSVTRGIITGESIPQLAERIASETGAAMGRSTLMYARTAMTGAQNAGRMERLHEAARMGIHVKKKWLATQDNRTRDTHRDLDGQEREIDEPFEVDGKEIDYPGDMKAHPSLVWNCRCTLIYVYPKYQKKEG